MSFNSEKLTEIEIQAKDGKPLPDGLTMAEKFAFNRFRCLYFLVKNKAIDLKSAKEEKQDIINEYESLALAEITTFKESDKINEIRRLLNQNYRGLSNTELVRFIDKIREVAMKGFF